MLRWVVALVLFTAPSLAFAQQAPPQRCRQRNGHTDYGQVHVGTVVVAQRHRFVSGDPNWDARMARFLGRVARVTRLSGVDGRGCPGVRLDIDGGHFFWRLRDLTLGAERPRGQTADGDDIPQACGQSEAHARYGSIRVGSIVLLGRHRPVGGDDNWSPPMAGYVGRTARVTELAGTDERGCLGVHIDADDGHWFWRVRDMRQGEDAPTGRVMLAVGVVHDHGRPNDSHAPTHADGGAPGIPQECGRTDATADYGSIAVGSEVVLGHHRPVDGETNWVEEMDAYVGQRARVTEIIGVDDQGCALIRVDVDQGDWYWRLRDARLP
jgi:hypothetical protein